MILNGYEVSEIDIRGRYACEYKDCVRVADRLVIKDEREYVCSDHVCSLIVEKVWRKPEGGQNE